MIFIEKKLETGYQYICEEVFGIVEIDSTQKIKGSILDDLIVLLLKRKETAQTITGTVKIDEKNIISYKFKREAQWKEEEKCENISILINKQENEFTQMFRSIRRALYWPKRFVVAFLEAWKRNY